MTLETRISPSRAHRLLLGAVAAFMLIDTILNVLEHSFGHDTVFGLATLLDLGDEASIPTWYASLQLALAALLLSYVAHDKIVAGDPRRAAWLMLAAGFYYLSLDEAVAVHEEWGSLLRGVVPATGLFRFRWVLVGLPLCLLLLFGFWPFLRSLPARARKGMLAAGALFVGSAAGMELPAGYLISTYGVQDLRYDMLNVVENGVELAAIALFIITLLRYMGASAGAHATAQHSPDAPVARDPALRRPVDAFPVRVVIPSHSVFRLLVLIAVGLALAAGAASIAGRFDMGRLTGLIASFGLAREPNLLDWYASLQLALAGIVLIHVAQEFGRRNGRRLLCCVLGASLFFLSLDEIVALPGEPRTGTAGIVTLTTLLQSPWLLLAVTLRIITAFVFVYVVRSVPAASRAGILIAGGLYVGGLAIGTILPWLAATLRSGSGTELASVPVLAQLLAVALLVGTLLHFAGREAGRSAGGAG